MSADVLRAAAAKARDLAPGDGWAVLFVASMLDDDAAHWDEMSAEDQAIALRAASAFLPDAEADGAP